MKLAMIRTMHSLLAATTCRFCTASHVAGRYTLGMRPVAIRTLLLLAPMLLSQACIIAPLRVANDLRVTVTDHETGAPIAGASVVYFACDIHDFDCGNGILVETTSDQQGRVDIKGRRKWGLWIAAPGGLPVTNHTIAIWAPGYSAYVFHQYGGNLSDMIDDPEVRDALNRIPEDQRSSDDAINPRRELIGGRIRLRPARSD